MAIKTFKCVICEVEVTKPQSYAYQNGRACRHHPEVQQNHDVQEQAKKVDLEHHKVKNKRQFGGYKDFDRKEPPLDLLKAFGIKNPNEHCWCCHKDGVFEHLFYERCLINMSKLELQTEDPISIIEVTEGVIGPNKKLQEIMKEELGDKIPLRRIEVVSGYPEWKLNQILNQSYHHDKKQLTRMMGMIVLCKECATQYEFPWLYARDRGVSLEKICLIGYLVKPTIDSIAAGEIASEEIAGIMNKYNGDLKND